MAEHKDNHDNDSDTGDENDGHEDGSKERARPCHRATISVSILIPLLMMVR